uniref:Ig-like domain-containing protein n=1 Tax=Sphaeramia orbicularis TaxID=375764 RepID=A0A673A6U0_9TELE
MHRCPLFCQVEVEEGAESVQLPFITTLDLPDDVRVRWFYYKDDEPKKLLHQACRSRTEMEINQVKTEDFSLTLKYPTDKDNYTYTCTIYSNENKILLKKRVELKVKGQYCAYTREVSGLLLYVYLFINE